MGKGVSLGPVLTGSFSSFSQIAEFHYDSEDSKTAHMLRLEITTQLFFFLLMIFHQHLPT